VTSVVVRLAAPLRPLAGNRERVAVEAPRPTVAGALEALGSILPAARDRIVTGGLATPVTDGAEIWILPAVSGG
jgi:molybdopterin converting factor small subunit